MNNINWFLLLSAIFPWTCVVVACWITPRLTRPDLFFSVTVQPGFRESPEGVKIIGLYHRILVIFSLVALLPLALLATPHPEPIVGVVGPALLALTGVFPAFVSARKRALAFHKDGSTVREISLAPRSKKLPGGWIAHAGPFLILGAVALCLAMKWPQIPSRIPIHWGASGKPNGWAAKSILAVFGLLFIGAAVCALLSAISFVVGTSVRRIHSSGEAGAREGRFVRVMLFFLLGMNYWLAALMGSIGLLSLRADLNAPVPEFWLIIPCEALIVATILFIGYRMGQGGWRGNGKSDDSVNTIAAPVGDRTPDECWKLGMFYYNPNDPAVLVEKRFGVGWTLNFAHTKSWTLIIGLAIFSIVIALLSLAMAR